ncbi:hypothetical protein Hypma_003581 [Hypsizygus marmoreus]|uniref:Flavin reductase like domain-containing protein n=1 Tax=Hypsizygus marmoreus TaxID=39966 RepID=A0A369J981_HYPMA|nr:hypothetical protein Hypma_003581 [Hypsizygus marmoreus]
MLSTTRLAPPFRAIARYSTGISDGKRTREQLKELLRHTAQPVAVVTAFMPSKKHEHPYHGATLSSFTSIAMDPYPLISFALRIPSRMATILNAARPEDPSHMVINLLSAEQASVAEKFARADLHPEPFFSVPYSLTHEGLPILEGSLGSMSCKLVSKAIPLHELGFLEGKGFAEGNASYAGDAIVSELFIARVIRVEKMELKDMTEDTPRTLPLIYHRRGYTSCHSPSRKSK